nr:hypothetical protein [candidate division Zixibacteria bacterium]
MAALRRIKALVIILSLVVMFAGGFTIMSTQQAEARYACCIWVMYCTQAPPIICWDVCIPVPCP